MKIGIIGTGIMGSIMAGFLTDGGADVYCIDTYKEHVDAINEKGLTLEHFQTGELTNYKVKAFTDASQIGEIMDVLVVLVKGPVTHVACEAAKCITDENTLILSLQNGIGHTDVLAQTFEKKNIMYGCMMLSGRVKAPGLVMKKYAAESYVSIGSVSGEYTEEMKEFTELCKQGGLNIRFCEDIDREIWIKLITNCTGNAICAITRLPVGRMLNTEIIDTGYQISLEIEREVVAVATAMGIPLETGHIKPVPTTNVHYPSMAQDVMAKKLTEIDYLNGAVARLGKQYGVPTPFNEMAALLIKTIENNYQYQWDAE